jgi:hypothetical protein
VFIAARLYARAAGVGFDTSPFRGFWHLIDADLLRARLGESLFYLHSQPPLFNLWLGLYAKLCPDEASFALAFALSYLALGALHALLLVRVAHALGVRGWLAFLPAALFCASPAALLYENFLFYSHPVLVLVSASAYLLYRLLNSGRPRDAWLLASSLLAIVLMRSLFHPLFLPCAGLAAVFGLRGCAGAVRRALLPFACAGLLVLALLAKNQILFGSFSLSSWGGMSLARVVLDRTPPAQRSAMIAGAELSPLAAVSGFKALARYPLAPELLSPRGIPLLDRTAKLDGQPNFHHHAFVAISQTLARDAVRVVRSSPAIYQRSVRENLAQSGKSAWTYRPLVEQRRRIAGYVRGYTAALGWFPGLGATNFLTVLALAFYGFLAARGEREERAGLLRYMSFCALYVVFVGALFERSENQRFRLLVDPFLLLLALHALRAGWLRLRSLGATRERTARC